MLNGIRFFLCILLPLLALVTAAKAHSTPPEFVGLWEVTQVALDSKDQQHWRYEPNDPRILGRSLVVGETGMIAFNFQNEICDQVAWSAELATSLGGMVENSFPRPQRAGLPKSPSLRDFELNFLDQPVAPYSATCSRDNNTGSRADRWADAWFASMGNETLIVGYRRDVILVLRKIKVGGSSKASFSCDARLSEVESLICSSPALAGFDRSVADAFRRSLRRRAGEKSVVRDEQRQWLIKRNACSVNFRCLEEEMRERIDFLMRD